MLAYCFHLLKIILTESLLEYEILAPKWLGVSREGAFFGIFALLALSYFLTLAPPGGRFWWLTYHFYGIKRKIKPDSIRKDQGKGY